MVDKRTWDEFRQSGLLWFINTILHAFGWAICVELDDNGSTVSAFPARVKYRGFSLDCNEAGYRKVSQYLKDNIDSIYSDAMGE